MKDEGRMMKNKWRMMKDEWRMMNDEGWMMKEDDFKLLKGFEQTEKLTNGRTFLNVESLLWLKNIGLISKILSKCTFSIRKCRKFCVFRSKGFLDVGWSVSKSVTHSLTHSLMFCKLMTLHSQNSPNLMLQSMVKLK